MLAGIIDLGNIVELDLSILVEVQLIVGSPDPDLPCIVEVTLEGSEEFVEVDSAILVPVEVVQ